MPNLDNDTTHKWRITLEKALREETRNDIIVPYHQVALAFPGGLRSESFDMQRIDGTLLKPWAENLGWRVQLAPEVTHPSQHNTPHIRFIRIVQE